MCSTPAPPSTARVAAIIWSGTGEVNISPAQAASSMPETDEAGVQRLVPGAAAGDQADLAADRRVAAVDDPLLVVDPELRMGVGDAAQCVGDHVVRVVDELVHRWLLAADAPGTTCHHSSYARCRATWGARPDAIRRRSGGPGEPC